MQKILIQSSSIVFSGLHFVEALLFKSYVILGRKSCLLETFIRTTTNEVEVESKECVNTSQTYLNYVEWF